MHSIESTDPAFRGQIILASAYFHTKPPEDRIYASCSRVLRHALIAAGLWTEYYRQGANAAFHGEEDKKYPLVRQWYDALIAMTNASESERLLEGGGDLELPAGASFTACWLTAKGKAAAVKFLAEHPEMEEKLRAEG